LIRRHPHVFGSVSATTPDAVIATWEGVKESERAEKGYAGTHLSSIDRLPRAMPVTRKAVEILAPRTSLTAPQDPDAGHELLVAVGTLINRGIDPDLALEASLRNLINSRVGVPDENETEQGRETA
jgi:hypothetical protein